MTREEFVENIVIGNKLISVGLDDYGQCYFIEWAEDGKIKEESCGSYNFNYKGYIEERFGEPIEHCCYYPNENMFDKNYKPTLEDCEHRGTYGYCFKCKYNDVKEYSFQSLVNLGIIDRRGNVIGPWNDILIKINEDENK